MEKMTVWMLTLCTLLSVCLFSACGSSNDEAAPFVIDSALVGTWAASYSDDGCTVNEDVTFSNAGTFIYHAGEDCDTKASYSTTNQGTWRTRNGLLYVTNTEVSDPDDDETGVEESLYYFITSTGELALIESEDLFSLSTGSPDSLIGEWQAGDANSDCHSTLIVSSDQTWSHDNECFDPNEDEHASGTYSINDDALVLSITDSSPETFTVFYKLWGSLLAVMEEDRLFIKQ